MKGVVLAGGLGTRLYPLTKVTNKHLLPVASKPMIYYPIQSLVDAEINDLLIVTGGESAGDFLRLLGNGNGFGLKRLNYTYQEGHGGIAAALALAEDFVDGDKMVVILGDNIIGCSISESVKRFSEQDKGARILLKEVSDPQRFGVAEMNGDRIGRIVEKPEHPKTNYAVVGVYMYPPDVFDIIRNLKPSSRNELEITDVNNAYIECDALEFDFLSKYWTDAGTFYSMMRASLLAMDKEDRQKLLSEFGINSYKQGTP